MDKVKNFMSQLWLIVKELYDNIPKNLFAVATGVLIVALIISIGTHTTTTVETKSYWHNVSDINDTYFIRLVDESDENSFKETKKMLKEELGIKMEDQMVFLVEDDTTGESDFYITVIYKSGNVYNMIQGPSTNIKNKKLLQSLKAASAE